ncbi:MAG: hypothetical protein Kow0059_09190 [Candidatus Sumerlaeia bacterium]
MRFVTHAAEEESSPTVVVETHRGGEVKRTPIGQLFSIRPHPWASWAVCSDTAVWTLSLGTKSDVVQPPEGWNSRPMTNRDGWRPAVAIQNAACMFYLPEMQWIWSPAPELSRPPYEHVLFQKPFVIPDDLAVVRGVITLVGCHEINRIYINGEQINRETDQLCFNLVKYDVTNSLRPGPNLLAMDVLAPEDPTHGYGGLGFRLDLTGVQTAAATPSSRPPAAGDAERFRRTCALILSTQDVIQGELVDLTARAFVIKHAAGVTSVDSRWVDSAQFAPRYEGATLTQSTPPLSPISVYPALSDKGGCGFHTTNLSIPGLVQDTRAPARILDRHGRVMTGEIAGMDSAHHLHIHHEPDLPPMMMDMDGVQEIQFVQPKRLCLSELKPPLLGRFARVMTIDGNVWHGFLSGSESSKTGEAGKNSENNASKSGTEEITAGRNDAWTLDTPYAGRLTFDPVVVAQIVFPFRSASVASMHRNAGRPEPATPPGKTHPLQVALIGDIPPQNTTLTELAAQVRMLSALMGYEAVDMQPADLLDQDAFNPMRVRIVVNMDAGQKFHHTWNQSGDVREALTRFIERGGHLVHIAPGTPFYFNAWRNGDRRNVKPCSDSFNDRFGLHVAFPGECLKSGMCFERPDNSARAMNFVRVDPPQGDPTNKTLRPEDLPAMIPFNAARDTRFRPVNSCPGTIEEGKNSGREPGSDSSHATTTGGGTGDPSSGAGKNIESPAGGSQQSARFIPFYRLISDTGEDYGYAAALSRVPNQVGGTSTVAYIAFPLATSQWEGVPAINFLFPWLLNHLE